MIQNESLLKVAERVLFHHNGNSLTEIQHMILRESLAGKTYESMKGYSPQHIKNEGKKLWDLLTKALGEKVSKINFKKALENSFNRLIILVLMNLEKHTTQSYKTC